MFDVNTTITLGLRTAGGLAEATVRWPTDEEWSAHHRKRKMFHRQLGRGATEYEIDSGDADAALYEAVKLNGAPPLSVGEASFIIDTIAQSDVMGVDLHAQDAEVTITTPMGEVKHTARIPTMDEVRTLRKSNRVVALPYNRQQIHTNLEASAALWDKCGGKAEGYAGQVPNIHKDAAIRAIISAVETETMPRYDEKHF